MPKKDPITGCEVLTFPEFVHTLAEHEGKEDIEIYEDIEKSIEEAQQEFISQYSDPDVVLKELQEMMKIELENWEENKKYWGNLVTMNRLNDSGNWISTKKFEKADSKPPYPVKILKVFNVKAKYTFSFHSYSFHAIALCDNGETVKFNLSCSHYNGTRIDPPDIDIIVEWEDKAYFNQENEDYVNFNWIKKQKGL